MTDNKKITGGDSTSHHDGIEVDDSMMEAVYLTSPNGDGRSTGDGGGGGDKNVDSDVDALLAELSMSGNQEEEQQQPQGANNTTNTNTANHAKNNSSSPSSETDDEAFNKLRESTTHLTSAIHAATMDFDSKLGLSKSVRNLDSNYHVSESFTSSISKLGSWWNTVDEQYQIGTKTKEVTNVISEKVGQTWSDVERSVSPKLSRQPPPDAAAHDAAAATSAAARDTTNTDNDDATVPVCNTSTSTGGGAGAGGVDIRKWNETIQRTNENIRKLDEEHKITKTTVETLAKGAEFLAQSIRAAVSSSRDDQDDDNNNNNDDNPAAFPCSPKRSFRGVRDEDKERGVSAGDAYGKGNNDGGGGEDDDVNFGFVVNKWVEDHSHKEQKQEKKA